MLFAKNGRTNPFMHEPPLVTKLLRHVPPLYYNILVLRTVGSNRLTVTVVDWHTGYQGEVVCAHHLIFPNHHNHVVRFFV